MDSIKLWLDDSRPVPDGWVGARTNDEARELMLNHEVSDCSLDFDLALGVESGMTGISIVRWMCEQNRIPLNVVIHSSNEDGVVAMQAIFAQYGRLVEWRPA